MSKFFIPVHRLNLIFIFLFVFFLSCTSERLNWPESDAQAKPWTRWWWMGNAVDQENISRELREMSDAGIGGVEITPIYGVKGEEERFIEFLSPEFSQILKYTVSEANNLGMGVDMPPGSGWRCGGPFVPEEYGLWSLKIHKYKLQKGETRRISSTLTNAVTASFRDERGMVTVVNPDEIFSAPSAGTVYIAERIKNRDMVKRASDGGKGWAIDTFNEEITRWYFEEFWRRSGIEDGLIRCFFHDSFEYTGDFTTNFLKEFKNRRGYDLVSVLHILAGDSDDKDSVARVKSDYRETLSDLVLESFIQPMTGWANSHGSLNRNQAHGSPGNILDLYAACDIPETEIFRTVDPGTIDIFVNKFASSAAHITGQKLISSESFTWLEEHWTVTTSDMVRAANRFLLAGINHMFFHGTCYSPDDAEWPGWLFYASTQVNNRNPLWRELPALFRYIERSQSVLQKTSSGNDLLIYWPYYDVAAMDGPLFNHLGVHRESVWFREHPIAELSERLTKAGYTFDYISDKQLADCRVADGRI
ncbi:MAG: glycosyl hydrolase, partial [Prolixibacteraceae bacterium]|nr:glycosyl hydrolase [Prolixibacteraceae bacterium]